MGRFTQTPSDAVLQNVLEVYERGLTVDALRRAENFAPLKNWGGIRGCVVATRIAANAGAQRLATHLTIRAWRTDPTHPEAQLQYGFHLSERRGPLALWRAMRGWKMHPEASSDQRAELLALRTRTASDLRDFAAAEKFIGEAEATSHAPWIRLQRAHLLERQDHVEKALEVAHSAVGLHRHPFYRPAIQTIAHLLQQLDRDEEAIELLKQANAVLQSGPVAAQLYGLLSENNRWAEAEAALTRYVEMSPLLELPLQKWVSSQRARAAHHQGKRELAADIARSLDDALHKYFLKNLEAGSGNGGRVQLDVSFIRQHFKTCAPATL